MRRSSSACRHQLRRYSTRPRRLWLRCQRSAASAAGKGSGWQAVAGGGRRWQAVAQSLRAGVRDYGRIPLGLLMHGTTLHRNRFLRDTTCITGRPARNSADISGHVIWLFLLFLLPLACHWPATTPPNSWRACDFSPTCPLELHPR